MLFAAAALVLPQSTQEHRDLSRELIQLSRSACEASAARKLEVVVVLRDELFASIAFGTDHLIERGWESRARRVD